MRELENGITRGQPETFHHLVSILHAAASLRLSYPLILLTHLARSHALYVLILYIPIERWILSLTTIINSWLYHSRNIFVVIYMASILPKTSRMLWFIKQIADVFNTHMHLTIAYAVTDILHLNSLIYGFSNTYRRQVSIYAI